MLGKLFKHDFRALSRTMRFLIPGILCLAFLTTAFLAVQQRQNYSDFNLYSAEQLFSPILILLAMFAGMGMGAAVILILVFVYVHYYRSMFSDEGYLTHTLPVKSWEIVLSKLLSALTWLVIGYAAIIVGALMILLGGTSAETLFNAGVFSDSYVSAISQLIKINGGTTVLLALPSTLVNACSGLLLVFLAITIGCAIANRHRIWVAIGIYIAISIGNSVLSTILTLISSLVMRNSSSETGLMVIQLLDVIKNIGVAVGCFFWIKHLLKHNLNLQ